MTLRIHMSAHNDDLHKGSAKRNLVNGVAGLDVLGKVPDANLEKPVGTHEIDTSTHGVSEVADAANYEIGAEVNNISDVDAIDLTNAGESILHYHASDRLIANISDMDKQSFTNLLVNGGFELWSAGAAAAPDGWQSSGTAPTITKESAVIKNGVASILLAANATNSALKIIISNPINYRGKTVTAGVWIKASAAGARLFIRDSSGYFYSEHSGGGNWEFITKRITVNGATTLLEVHITPDNTSGTQTAYFDGAILVEGSICPAFSPKPLTITDKDVAGGLAGLDGSAKVPDINLEKPVGTHEIDTSTHGVSEVADAANYEIGAEVNNISDVDAIDLTNAGESILHYHASDRLDANLEKPVGIHEIDTSTHGVSKIGAITSGSYVGNNSENRAIAHGLGVEPVSITITIDAAFGILRIRDDRIQYNDNTYLTATWSVTDFIVGDIANYAETANASGVTYYWIAFG